MIQINDNKKDIFYYILKDYDIPIYDMINCFENNKEYFADATHLNYEGAKVFTDILNNL